MTTFCKVVRWRIVRYINFVMFFSWELLVELDDSLIIYGPEPIDCPLEMYKLLLEGKFVPCLFYT